MLGATDVPVITQDPADPYQVGFELVGVETPHETAAIPTLVNDPAPTVLGAVQMGEADVVGCPQEDLSNRRHAAGRVVAVLFSEEVTAESVQDKVRPEEITAFRIDGNRVVERRAAARPPHRVPRACASPSARSSRARSRLKASPTRPGQSIGGDHHRDSRDADRAGRRRVGADPARPTAPRRVAPKCGCSTSTSATRRARWSSASRQSNADADGHYQFDYVLMPPHAIKFVAIDPESDDLRILRFKVARDGQRLNVNVVFLGRGTFAGRTLAEDGVTPLAEHDLRVTSLTDQSQYGATTDALGRFEIQRIPVGNILVEAVNTARPAQIFVSEYIPFAGATITRDLVLLDVDTTGITVKTGTVTGHVAARRRGDRRVGRARGGPLPQPIADGRAVPAAATAVHAG